MDWAKSEGIPYTYTFELSPGRLEPVPGFMIDPSQILPVAQENWAGLRSLAKAILIA
jgi:hypothetical protein